jgi:hypothetical protein
MPPPHGQRTAGRRRAITALQDAGLHGRARRVASAEGFEITDDGIVRGSTAVPD